jgi:hypothetical protein
MSLVARFDGLGKAAGAAGWMMAAAEGRLSLEVARVGSW